MPEAERKRRSPFGAGTPLRPEVVSQVARMEVRARRIVEGLVTGRHRSPFKGSSVEFAQHREYVPGDDIKHVDWKVYAKSDRYYIKEYEEETNLRCYLLLDSSESMRYGHSPDTDTKYTYACAALSALAYLLLRQQDQVGFGMFDSEVRVSVQPSAHPQTMRSLLEHMITTEPHAKTDLSEIFGELAHQWRRKGIVVIASDLLDEPERVMKGLALLRAAGHEVVLFHILDEAERSFPFEGNTLFKGLEEMPELMVDPRALRDGYMRSLSRFLDQLKAGCARENVDFVPLTVGDPLGAALATYIAQRNASAGGRRR